MFREIAQIALAIQLSSSHIPVKRAEQLAATIQKNAEIADIDPLITVSIITHESDWFPSRVSVDGKDWGLLQLRGEYYGGKNEWLLNPDNNIRVGSYIMRKDIDFCTKHLKREPTTPEWLSLYTGECKNSMCWCHPTPIAKQFSEYEQCLERAVSDIEEESSVDCRKIYRR